MDMGRRTLLQSLASTGLIAGVVPFASKAAIARTKHETLDYGPNKLDWYPAISSRSNAPVLVFVHGGAWAMGNRGQVNSKPESSGGSSCD